MFRFFKNHLFWSPKMPTGSFAGKTVIVTGANVGLGKEAARHFVAKGASKVILGCRNMDKGNEAAQSIVQSEKVKDAGKVEVWQLDLCSYESVLAFGERLNGLDRLDVLVENAALATIDFKMAEGHESQVTTNVISTFLLALLALPKLKETAARTAGEPDYRPPHLVVLSSGMIYTAQLPEARNKDEPIFAQLDKNKSNLMSRYPVTKLLEVLVVREWTRTRAPAYDYPVIINTMDPGLCESALRREVPRAGLGARVVVGVLEWMLARPTAVGARTEVDAALKGYESHGEFITDQEVEKVSAFCYTKEGFETQRRVWRELADILEEIKPGVTSNL
ncbi:short chain dehydrogenase [Lineolata rhizophorae]|uniref:Short chain dehydrogenase n=1 Tax=Lineolata rhizophorae TaxID=578093 RepID=A0A6A6NRP5_9PEZI|nr:short chain dehydrogenase [Lineolata rhizophorae]